MFARKSQTVLSDHYGKVIDHDENDGAASLGPAGEEEQDDFITLKRRDHELNERELPASSFLSKRKLKQGMSKKAMLSSKGNPTKLTFDDEGGAHAVYELGDEDDFAALGDAEELRKQFVAKEGEELAKQDVLDKQRVREKRLEKKRKRKEFERGGASGGADEDGNFDPMDEIVHPDFSGVDLGSGDSGDSGDEDHAQYERPARAPVTAKNRRARFEDDDVEPEDRAAKKPKVDLEALALQALSRR